jgi:hypothetical protein
MTHVHHLLPQQRWPGVLNLQLPGSLRIHQLKNAPGSLRGFFLFWRKRERNDDAAHHITQLEISLRTQQVPIVAIHTGFGDSPVRINGFKKPLISSFDDSTIDLIGILSHDF